MRVKVYELRPGTRGFVLDMRQLHCVIDIQQGKGSFQFHNSRREKLIRSLFDAPSNTFTAGGISPGGVYVDAVQTHPAWSVEAIKAIVKDDLYGFNLGATIEYD
jgi:hypothetical protein